MFDLREYQEGHVQSLTNKVAGLLDSRTPKICVFRSPTGSGKTIMVAETIKRLKRTASSHDVSFIWIAVRSLHTQSKDKLESYYEKSRSISCAYFEDLQDRQIQSNEILFFNWESIRQKDNVYIRDNERDHNLSSVIKNTKAGGRKIVLVIDESHHSAGTERAQEVIELISPDVTIEVSATPSLSNMDELENVDLDQVREAGMIKRLIKINHELDDPSGSTDEWILDAALKKREEIRVRYERLGSGVNPLVLIQIPDRRGRAGDMVAEVEKLLARRGITTANGRLAIYLSENRENLENIARPGSEADALIFKQAITVGWDCPRSSVLVLFREWHDHVFSIQTVGRIMRMPELTHYNDDVLDCAYVYTNMREIEIAQDIVADYITKFESRRNDDLYERVDLPSVYIRRQHAKTRLDSRFAGLFMEECKRHGLIDRMTKPVVRITREVLSEAEIDHIDREQTVRGATISAALGDAEIQRAFDLYVHGLAEGTGFAAAHSSGVIRRALYGFFRAHGTRLFSDMQRMVLYPKNRTYFDHMVALAAKKYRRDVADRVRQEIEAVPKWNVPRTTEHTRNHVRREYAKCVAEPMYALGSDTELSFMGFLDEAHNSVRWWYKNGENDKKYFAIEYHDPAAGRSRSFYVDFVVYMDDGRIGLFDTKSGHTETDPTTALKARALAEYAKSDGRLFGGIVIFRDGAWLCSDRADYAPHSASGPGWRLLDLG